VDYHIAFPNARHREARVTVRYENVGPGPLRVRMSRTSPGRYALHEFAKNVYDVEVRGVDGREVRTVHRPNPHEWVVEDHGGAVTFTYTLYADRADGTYAQVDETHAHLNVPATFAFAPDLMSTPVRLTVDVGERGWDVATQLFPDEGGDPYVFTAPDHRYFMDSPLEIGDLAWRERTLPDGQTLRIAMHHLGTDAELDAYADATWRISDELAAVFGGYPRFDGGTYTFLACYTPWSSGDGMEHRNSTVLTSSGSLETSMVGLLGTVAHEFVHAWSIERIRPASLEPFDFEAANMSRELWFGEGFTSYLDDVALVRAGVIEEADFLRRVAGSASAAILAPGRRFFSPVEMSMQAPFVDAATSVDPQNRVNTFLSYYTWGAAVGLGLDLTLRTRFDLALEDLMQEMWRRHGDPERPYDVEDIESALAAVTGDAAFAADFFDRYVRGREVPPYAELFRAMGAELTEPRSGAPWLTGAQLAAAEGGGILVASNTLAGDPLYEAGVDRGDRIIAVDGEPATPEAFTAALEAAGVGGRLTMSVAGRGETRTVEVTLQGTPGHSAEVRSGASPEEEARRRAWVAGAAVGAGR
jgi:predicted metalloprotease with PDZ domain